MSCVDGNGLLGEDTVGVADCAKAIVTCGRGTGTHTKRGLSCAGPGLGSAG